MLCWYCSLEIRVMEINCQSNLIHLYWYLKCTINKNKLKTYTWSNSVKKINNRKKNWRIGYFKRLITISYDLMLIDMLTSDGEVDKTLFSVQTNGRHNSNHQPWSLFVGYPAETAVTFDTFCHITWHLFFDFFQPCELNHMALLFSRWIDICYWHRKTQEVNK